MPNRQFFDIQGARELEKVLSDLPAQVKRRVVRNAVRAGARVVQKEAKRLAPYDPKRKRGEHLRDEIIVRLKKGTRDIYQVGPSANVPHAHLIEFGTGIRRFKEPQRVMINGVWYIVETTGAMPEKPFLRPAADQKANEAINKIGENMGRGIEREAVKLSGKYYKSGLKPKRRRR